MKPSAFWILGGIGTAVVLVVGGEQMNAGIFWLLLCIGVSIITWMNKHEHE